MNCKSRLMLACDSDNDDDGAKALIADRPPHHFVLIAKVGPMEAPLRLTLPLDAKAFLATGLRKCRVAGPRRHLGGACRMACLHPAQPPSDIPWISQLLACAWHGMTCHGISYTVKIRHLGH